MPVYIWLTDINQDSVEKEVEQKTGLTKDTLSVRTETISAELAQAITDESTRGFSEKTITEFNSYLERTAQAREIERINTDTYISERRAIARSKIEAKNTAFVSSAEISEKSIIFQSAYAPMIIAELSEYQVQMLAGRMDVVEMSLREDYDYEEAFDDLQGVRNITGATRVYAEFNLYGDTVVIGILDKYNVTTDSDVSADPNIIPDPQLPADRFLLATDDSVAFSEKTHAECVAKICAGNYGIAQDATVYHASVVKKDNNDEICDKETFIEALESLLNEDVKVINSSGGFKRGTDFDSYDDLEKYVDYIVVTQNVTFVNCAGNGKSPNEPEYIDGDLINSPGLADNVITVNAYDPRSGDILSDDQMYNYSYDENGGCMKPDVVASGRGSAEWIDDYMPAEGTSLAAPVVTGFIALILELKPSLASRPEVVKAIVLASCHRKVKPAISTETPELMEDGLTEKQGSGVFDPYIALSIVSHGTYGGRMMDAQETEIDVSFIQPRYDSAGMNVSIAWLRQNRKNILNSVVAVNREDFDIDLWNNSNRIGDSFESNSSTEMIYHTFAGVTSDLYTLEIRKYQGNGNDTRIGYAWSVSNASKQNNEKGDGIYLIRNVANGYYLQANVATGAVTQNVLTGNLSQIWLVTQNAMNNYYPDMFWKVQNAASFNGYLSYVVSNDNGYSVATRNNIDNVIGIPYSGNVNYFMASVENQLCVLGVDVGSELTSVKWIPISDTSELTEYQLWYMEPCAYQQYDANLDGSISSGDARFLLRGAVGLETINSVNLYLGDFNMDNVISAEDARLSLRHSVGLDN